MKHKKCSDKINKGDVSCIDCGSTTFKEEGIKNKPNNQEKDQNKKRMKIVLACLISSIFIVLIVVTFVVVLPTTGNDFWTQIPECTIINNQLEAGLPCDALDLIEFTDDPNRSWDISIAENNIDTSKLGRFSVVYLLVSGKTERELIVEYEVVEGEIPQIKQLDSEFEYGEVVNIASTFELLNMKDFKYEIDDSDCNYDIIGTYPIYVRLYNNREIDETYNYELAIIDTELPVINCPKELKIMQGEQLQLLDSVNATDNYDGDITDKVLLKSDFDNNVPGIYEASFSVTDTSNNSTQTSMKIEVIEAAGVGDSIDINNWTITATKWYFDDRIDDRGYWDHFYWYYDARNGETFFVVNLKVKNNSDEKDCFADEIVFPDEEVVYLSFVDSSYYKQETFELRNDITNSDEQYYVKPGNSKSGKLYFAVSEQMQDHEGSIILEIYSLVGKDSGKSIYIILREE